MSRIVSCLVMMIALVASNWLSYFLSRSPFLMFCDISYVCRTRHGQYRYRNCCPWNSECNWQLRGNGSPHPVCHKNPSQLPRAGQASPGRQVEPQFASLTRVKAPTRVARLLRLVRHGHACSGYNFYVRKIYLLFLFPCIVPIYCC